MAPVRADESGVDMEVTGHELGEAFFEFGENLRAAIADDVETQLRGICTTDSEDRILDAAIRVVLQSPT